MEEQKTGTESRHDPMSAECSDEQHDSWASGLRRRAHLCKSGYSFLLGKTTESDRQPYPNPSLFA